MQYVSSQQGTARINTPYPTARQTMNTSSFPHYPQSRAELQTERHGRPNQPASPVHHGTRHPLILAFSSIWRTAKRWLHSSTTLVGNVVVGESTIVARAQRLLWNYPPLGELYH